MNNYSDRLDARIETSASYGDSGIQGVITVWTGGEIAGITEGFLEGADERFVQRQGDFIQIGDLRVQIVDFDEQAGVYLVRRADADPPL